MTEPRPWPQEADRLAHSLAPDEAPTAWFDRLYDGAARGAVAMPWDRGQAHPLLQEWTAAHPGLSGRAVQVGCGLGADGEHLATLGLTTTAFDISPTAVELARSRNRSSSVDYRVADLLGLPEDMLGGFDLVVEIFTVQSIPRAHRAAMAAGVRSLVAPGGRLLVIQGRRTDPDDDKGPPWPLDEAEMGLFAHDPLVQAGVHAVPRPGLTGEYWLGEFKRPAGPTVLG